MKARLWHILPSFETGFARPRMRIESGGWGLQPVGVIPHGEEAPKRPYRTMRPDRGHILRDAAKTSLLKMAFSPVWRAFFRDLTPPYPIAT